MFPAWNKNVSVHMVIVEGDSHLMTARSHCGGAGNFEFQAPSTLQNLWVTSYYAIYGSSSKSWKQDDWKLKCVQRWMTIKTTVCDSCPCYCICTKLRYGLAVWNNLKPVLNVKKPDVKHRGQTWHTPRPSHLILLLSDTQTKKWCNWGWKSKRIGSAALYQPSAHLGNHQVKWRVIVAFSIMWN